jgi:hypothetical protein
MMSKKTVELVAAKIEVTVAATEQSYMLEQLLLLRTANIGVKNPRMLRGQSFQLSAVSSQSPMSKGGQIRMP